MISATSSPNRSSGIAVLSGAANRHEKEYHSTGADARHQFGVLAVTTSQHVSTDFNQRVGANIQRLRKEKGMSQADLARELTARGYSFQHQGILKIERASAR